MLSRTLFEKDYLTSKLSILQIGSLVMFRYRNSTSLHDTVFVHRCSRGQHAVSINEKWLDDTHQHPSRIPSLFRTP